MKKNSKKGFTLAELLIVVAIIGILVAISIPVFTSQLKKAKDATNVANARSMYAHLVADFLDDGAVNSGPKNGTSDFTSSQSLSDDDLTLTVDEEIYKFTKLDGASIEYTTGADGHPIVKYTHGTGLVPSSGATETFGASGAESGESGD